MRPPRADAGAPPVRAGKEPARDDLAVDRLAEILLHAQAADDLAIELHVLDFADDEDAHAGLDIKGKVLEHAQRVGLAGDIDEQGCDRRVQTLQSRARFGDAADQELGCCAQRRCKNVREDGESLAVAYVCYQRHSRRTDALVRGLLRLQQMLGRRHGVPPPEEDGAAAGSWVAEMGPTLVDGSGLT